MYVLYFEQSQLSFTLWQKTNVNSNILFKLMYRSFAPNSFEWQGNVYTKGRVTLLFFECISNSEVFYLKVVFKTAISLEISYFDIVDDGLIFIFHSRI